MKTTILIGDVRARLREMPDNCVHCVVTSPPYWGLRDYKIEPSAWGGDPACAHEWVTEEVEREMRHGLGLAASPANTRGGAVKCAEQEPQRFSRGFCRLCGAWLGCLGLEPTPELFIEHTVEVFRAVRRVLRDDGTLWLNIGDSYATGAGKVGDCPGGGAQGAAWRGDREPDPKRGGKGDGATAMGPMTQPNRMPLPGLKPKDLVGIPWMLAFALRADGWWLRQDIIWSKPNPMPESVTDRCTKAHEYLFLLTKSARYYYDQEAILEPCSPGTHARLAQDVMAQIGSERAHAGGKTNGNMKAVRRLPDKYKGSLPGRDGGPGQDRRGVGDRKLAGAGSGIKNNESFQAAMAIMPEKRNKRSVWEIATQPYAEAHFATYPEKLVEPCILAGSRAGDTVLDPFCGSGTTGVVALRHGRNFVGIELNAEYAALAEKRIGDGTHWLNAVGVEGETRDAGESVADAGPLFRLAGEGAAGAGPGEDAAGEGPPAV